MNATLIAKEGATVRLSEAQVLALQEHFRLCKICCALCTRCRELLCCRAAEKLVERFLSEKGGCA